MGMETELLRRTAGTIGMKCPVCEKAQIAERLAIDPPGARLLFYPCCEDCAGKAHVDQVTYTDAARNIVLL